MTKEYKAERETRCKQIAAAEISDHESALLQSESCQQICQRRKVKELEKFSLS